MHLQDTDLLIRLILAHLVVDFLTGTELSGKAGHHPLSNKLFYVHLVLVGLITYLFIGDWLDPWPPLLLLVSHGLIDWGRARFSQESTRAFVIDQLLHLCMVFVCWFWLSGNHIPQAMEIVTSFLLEKHYHLIITGYILVSIPGGLLIGYLTQSWRQDIGASDPLEEESLQHAGKWIGILERVLVFTFVIVGDWRPIGFLLAAKSVFRFGDLKESKDRKRTEYILIGTLLSFTWSIAVGLLITKLL